MVHTHAIDIKADTLPDDVEQKYHRSPVQSLLKLYSRILYTIAIICIIITCNTIVQYKQSSVGDIKDAINTHKLYVNQYMNDVWNYTAAQLHSQSNLLYNDNIQSNTIQCVPTTQCNINKAENIEDLYVFTTTVQSDGIHVHISYVDTCCILPVHQPIIYFRVTAIGTSLATAPTHVTIPYNKYDTDTIINIIEYGYYSVSVRAMLYNVTSDMPERHYDTLNIDDNEPGIFINRLISYHALKQKASIVRFDSNSQYSIDRQSGVTENNNLNLPCEYYNELWYGNYLIPNIDMISNNPSTQLCGSRGYELQTGRYTNWYISRGTHMGLELTLKDAQYIPYHCIQPYSADAYTGEITNHRPQLTSTKTLHDIVQHARWINFIGDSVTRHLFEYTCIALGGVKNEPSAAYSEALRHHPLSCSGGTAADNTDWFITYSAWWYPLYIPIIDTTDFQSMCNIYNDTDVEQQVKIWPATGWPACQTQSDSIRSMKKPTLSYFGWGSHPSNVGTAELNKYFNEYVFSKNYFQSTPTLYGLTTAVHTGLIPDKFGRQAIMRNNERISTANSQLIAMLQQQQKSNQLPTYGNNHTDWTPILDVYSPSYVAIEVTAFDAVHSEHYFKRQAVAYLTNMLANAPNYQF